MVVDGIKAQDGQLTSAELTSLQHFVTPMFLGSAPEFLHKELKVNKVKFTQIIATINTFK